MKKEVIIGGKKILKGRDQEAGEFIFTLTEIDMNGNEKENGVKRTVRNSIGEAGQETSFTFDEIDYTMSQFYNNRQSDGSAYFYYVVQETIPEDAVNGVKDAVIYDQSKYLIIVRLWMEEDEPNAEWKAYPYDGNGVPTNLQPGQTWKTIPGFQHKTYVSFS